MIQEQLRAFSALPGRTKESRKIMGLFLYLMVDFIRRLFVYPSVSSEESVGQRISDVEVDDADHLSLHGSDLATGVRAVAHVHEVLLKINKNPLGVVSVTSLLLSRNDLRLLT